MNTENHIEKVKKLYGRNDLNFKELAVGQDIYFDNEKLPMKLKALGERFGVCTRKINKRQDADLLHFEVERGAYFTFMDAYNSLKNDLVYSCLDFEEKIKAPHNMIFNNWDFNNQEDIEDLLNELENGSVELSKRNYSILSIDFSRTKFNRS